MIKFNLIKDIGKFILYFATVLAGELLVFILSFCLCLRVPIFLNELSRLHNNITEGVFWNIVLITIILGFMVSVSFPVAITLYAANKDGGKILNGFFNNILYPTMVFIVLIVLCIIMSFIYGRYVLDFFLAIYIAYLPVYLTILARYLCVKVFKFPKDKEGGKTKKAATLFAKITLFWLPFLFILFLIKVAKLMTFVSLTVLLIGFIPYYIIKLMLKKYEMINNKKFLFLFWIFAIVLVLIFASVEFALISAITAAAPIN